MLRFERLSISNGGFDGSSMPNIPASVRAGSPPGGSILITSAPQSASTPPAAGPATQSPSSTTFTPSSGPLIGALCHRRGVAWRSDYGRPAWGTSAVKR